MLEASLMPKSGYISKKMNTFKRHVPERERRVVVETVSPNPFHLCRLVVPLWSPYPRSTHDSGPLGSVKQPPKHSIDIHTATDRVKVDRVR